MEGRQFLVSDFDGSYKERDLRNPATTPYPYNVHSKGLIKTNNTSLI